MTFSHICRSPRSPLVKLRRRRSQPPTQLTPTNPDWTSPEYADLFSKEKGKQKLAIQKYLSDKVKKDWQFPPLPDTSHPHGEPDLVAPSTANAERTFAAMRLEQVQVQDETCEDPGYQVDAASDGSADALRDQRGARNKDDDAQSTYSIVSEDDGLYRFRLEWSSELSENERILDCPVWPSFPGGQADGATFSSQPCIANKSEKRDARRRALREEMAWNHGLAWFEARRDAWTGARVVRVRSKPASPDSTSPRSPRRFFFRHSMTPSISASGHAANPDGGSGTISEASVVAKEGERELKRHRTRGSSASDPTSPHSYPVQTLLPVAQPLLPPTNALRASISSSLYITLYEKVVINNIQPTCPVNLSDMLRSCVVGWKRDGEWPPRPCATDTAVTARRKKSVASPSEKGPAGATRRLSFGLLNRDREEESRAGKGFRRNLQRVFGITNAAGAADTTEPGRIRQVS